MAFNAEKYNGPCEFRAPNKDGEVWCETHSNYRGPGQTVCWSNPNGGQIEYPDPDAIGAPELQFKMSSRMPGKAIDAASWHGLADMQAELGGLARVLDALVVGQSIEITRLS